MRILFHLAALLFGQPFTGVVLHWGALSLSCFVIRTGFFCVLLWVVSRRVLVVVFEWGTFSSGWSLGGVLFHLDGLWVRYFFLRVVFGWGASSGWSLGGVLFPQGGL